MEVLAKAIGLILSGDGELISICIRSLRLALTSLLLASLLSLPISLYLGFHEFRGKRLLLIIINSLMALPTVVIGLTVYSLLSRSGPLGYWGLLFTPWAIIIGQVILILPILISMIHATLSQVDPILIETLNSYGATRGRKELIIIREQRLPIIAAHLSGFGRVIGEVGVSMMLGGNIRWYTRTITTTIALESGKGDFELALALGLILIILSFTLNLLIQLGAGRE